MLKRILSLLAALAVCAGCMAAVSAEEPSVFDMPAAGLKFVSPPEYESAKGLITTDGLMELGVNNYYSYFYYLAVTREEYDRLQAENPDALQSRAGLLFYAFALGDGRDFSYVTGQTGGSFTADRALLLGQEGGYSFYLYMAEDAGFAASVGGEYGEEYAALCAMRDETAAAFTCSAPVNEHTGMDGAVIRFTATDLDGNPVSSEELFSKHAVTLVNIWATWCGPCVGELAELQAIHTRLLEKDCAVVGLLTDMNVEEARRLIRENGITYDVVLVWNDLSYVFPYSAIPTSILVDRNGAFLGTKIVGAQPDLYEAAVEPFLPAAANP